MNILLVLSQFASLTGSEIYTYELARVLTSRDHKVTIMANLIGGEIAEKAGGLGISLYHYFNHPSDLKFDILHCAQPSPTNYALHFFPNIPAVCTIHSQLVYEAPLLDDQIKKYICIRPQIQEKIITVDGIDKDKTVVIYNGVDTTRFNKKGTEKSRPAVLFVGTADYLRAQTIQDLVLRTKKENKELLLVGAGFRVEDFPEHVLIGEPRWDIEAFDKTCQETASVYLGRTTIEGWMCGKPGWIYDVDEKGNILDISLTEVPKDLTQFDIEFMTDKILEVYNGCLR